MVKIGHKKKHSLNLTQHHSALVQSSKLQVELWLLRRTGFVAEELHHLYEKKIRYGLKEKTSGLSLNFKIFASCKCLTRYLLLTFKVRLFPGQVSNNSLQLSEFAMLGVNVCFTVSPNVESHASPYYQLKQYNSASVKIHAENAKL